MTATQPRPPRALPSELFVAFVAEVNEGKSHQWATAATALRPDGVTPILDGVLVLNTEASTMGTIQRAVGDADGRIHVVSISRREDAVKCLRSFGLSPGSGPPRPLPSGHRIDAVVLDSASGLFRLERDAVKIQMRVDSEKSPKYKAMPETSGERPENNEKSVALRATGMCGPIMTDLHDAGHTHGLLTMVTCHAADRYLDDDETKDANWIGKRCKLPPSIREALRANANYMWFLHSVLPNFRGLEPHMVNAARTSDDPKLKKRHAAITDRGIFKEFGDLGDVCKRQGDDEGSHFQRTFGSLVPTYWHPDHVRVPDDAPSIQPNFGAILTHAIYGE